MSMRSKQPDVKFQGLSRRDVLQIAASSAAGLGVSGWMPKLMAASQGKNPPKSCILLWMAGGPSQLETLDPKPGQANGGPTKAIKTSVPGIELSDNFPGLAKHMQNVALIRSMQTREGDHGRATQLMTTGFRPGNGAVDYPVLGSLVADRLDNGTSKLPSFVSIAGMRRSDLGSGYLGPKYAPLFVSGASNDPNARANLTIENLDTSYSDTQLLANRQRLLTMMRNNVPSSAEAALKHAAVYDQAISMVETRGDGAFNLDEEPVALRDAYGRTRFGQGCLLARRLVERGVPFVEVTLDQAGDASWDSHIQNFAAVKNMCQTLDPAWSTLLSDLKDRNLLDSTLVVWMGEFGRTPKINSSMGRDHFPDAWSVALAGAAINGGQVIGATNEDGMEVKDRPVAVSELYSTILEAIGISHTALNQMGDRPIGIVDEKGAPIQELLS